MVHSAEAIHKSSEGMKLESEHSMRVQFIVGLQQKQRNTNRKAGFHPHPHMVKYRCCIWPHSFIETLSPHKPTWNKFFKVVHCSTTIPLIIK